METVYTRIQCENDGKNEQGFQQRLRCKTKCFINRWIHGLKNRLWILDILLTIHTKLNRKN